MTEIEVIPMDRSYIELVSELARLAEALGTLEPPASVAMSQFIRVLGAPRFLATPEEKP